MGAITIKQLQEIHGEELKSYRNTCLVVQKIGQYLNTTFLNKEKVLYLNKEGRKLIGSDKEIKQGHHIEHSILRNEAYIHLQQPYDWETEKNLEYTQTPADKLGIVIKGMNVATKTRMISDAFYTRNGYTFIVEIDNKADMKDNHKKLKGYVDCFKTLDTPRLQVFTKTTNRKNAFKKWMSEYKLQGEAYTFEELN